MFVLSVFPGIDLLGHGFEEEGFCVVRGPDLLWGGDICTFHPPAGKFDGVIGGSPCQDFSKIRRAAPTGNGRAMLDQFQRVVTEARPEWWLLENVPGVPDIVIPGYTWQRIDVKATEFGLKQSRLRHFQFGDREGRSLVIERQKTIQASEACCLATEGRRAGRRGFGDFCELQGLPAYFELPALTIPARYQAVGNGVPVPMGRAIARGIKNLKSDVTVCACGCGRVVTGKAITAGAACRMRVMRRKRNTPDSNFTRSGYG